MAGAAESIRAGLRRLRPPATSPPRAPSGGWRVVARKEFADHLLSIRFVVLLLLIGVTAPLVLNSAAGGITEAAPEASTIPGLFIRLFTAAPEALPVSFITIVQWIAPLLGIAFGFDAINGERSQGTLPRLVAQPIHRDDVINGKFVAGLAVIAVVLAGLTLLVAGLGLIRLGIVPTAGEVARLAIWVALTIVYAAFWLGFAILCSVALRRAATSALVSIATWVVFTLFAGLLVGALANAIAPVPEQATAEEVLRNDRVTLTLTRLSPAGLYEQATEPLLNPTFRAFGLILVAPQDLGRILPSTLSVEQSLLLVWPQVVALVALTVICFAAAYVLFMRQEIRA
jgi:ABC-2 type transport system permease protein